MRPDREGKGFRTRIQREKESEGISEEIDSGAGARREMNHTVFEVNI